MKKALLIILTTLTIFPVLKEVIEKRSHAFTVEKIFFAKGEPTEASDQDIYYSMKLSDQTFTYLGRGTQFYVFESPDSEYVIKFLRSDRIKPKLWVQLLHFPKFLDRYRKKVVENKKNKFTRTLDACHLAYERVKAQTGLMYLHLNNSNLFSSPVTVVDKMGRSHKIDLNTTRFTIQKKADLFVDVLLEAKEQKNEKKIKYLIDSFLKEITLRCKKGVSNTDPNVFKNFGCIGNKVVEIDFGDFFNNHKLVQPPLFKHEISRYTKRFRKWVKTHMPSMLPYFDKKFEQELKSYAKDYSKST